MNTLSISSETGGMGFSEEGTTPYPVSGLISRIVSKDKIAFNEIYNRFSQVVFNLALRVVRDRGEAEEIVQDVFFQVWDRASSYDPNRGSESTWIINMTRSRAIDRLRTLSYKKFNVEIDEERINPKADFLRISESNSEMRVIIQKSLEALPEEQKVAVEMAYFDGFTHYEIADKLNKPVGTIKTRITLGVAKLRKHLAPYLKELE